MYEARAFETIVVQLKRLCCCEISSLGTRNFIPSPHTPHTNQPAWCWTKRSTTTVGGFDPTLHISKGCTRAIIKTYGVKNEIAGMKNTYELTIPDTLVPIENPISHLHRGAL